VLSLKLQDLKATKSKIFENYGFMGSMGSGYKPFLFALGILRLMCSMK